MVGFYATADSSVPVRTDLDNELDGILLSPQRPLYDTYIPVKTRNGSRATKSSPSYDIPVVRHLYGKREQTWRVMTLRLEFRL
jgi:hypothetical protein